jgi:hypothetical protein
LLLESPAGPLTLSGEGSGRFNISPKLFSVKKSPVWNCSSPAALKPLFFEFRVEASIGQRIREKH